MKSREGRRNIRLLLKTKSRKVNSLPKSLKSKAIKSSIFLSLKQLKTEIILSHANAAYSESPNQNSIMISIWGFCH